MQLALYLKTIKYLRAKQILFRIYYALRKKLGLGRKYEMIQPDEIKASELKHRDFLVNPDSYSDNTFTFLNLEKEFNNEIDWGFKGFGKLWQYNLHYFDFVNSNLDPEKSAEIMIEFAECIAEYPESLEPYPTSLRIVNWVKFLVSNPEVFTNEQKAFIDDSLYRQASVLTNNIEYHLLGNHILENGLALFMAACYFKDSNFLGKSLSILTVELEEQILADGGHFELSPTYHRVILERMLDCYNIALCNSDFSCGIFEKLKKSCEMMLGWLEKMTYPDGSTPLFNDSTVAGPKSADLLKYGKLLDLAPVNVTLKESGYRKYQMDNYTVFFDVGLIGPEYIPGHAHADTLNFEMMIGNKPFIVDTGTSTYEIGSTRDYERSTFAHNTVVIDKKNQSHMWGAFRVAERAYPLIIEEHPEKVIAMHDGYRKKRISHTRVFLKDENSFTYEDIIQGGSIYVAEAFLHLHPDVKIKGISSTDDNKIWTIDTEAAIIELESHNEMRVEEAYYNYAPDMNIHIEAKKLSISFVSGYKCSIRIK